MNSEQDLPHLAHEAVLGKTGSLQMLATSLSYKKGKAHAEHAVWAAILCVHIYIYIYVLIVRL